MNLSSLDLELVHFETKKEMWMIRKGISRTEPAVTLRLRADALITLEKICAEVARCRTHPNEAFSPSVFQDNTINDSPLISSTVLKELATECQVRLAKQREHVRYGRHHSDRSPNW